MTRLQKVLRMSRHEAAWRATAALRVQRDRVGWHLRRPAWDRTRLGVVLGPESLDGELRRQIARRDWADAARTLRARLLGRPCSFVLDPQDATELPREILKRWPAAPADASSRADRILSGKYDVLGYRGLSFDSAAGCPDWHMDPVHGRSAPRTFWADVPYLDPSIGDHKIIWELNRHQHWLALGRALWLTRDPRYERAIVAQLDGWLHANPPRTGINWASALELALRALSWTWAVHFLLGVRADGGNVEWLIDCLIALDAQLRHVEQNLSYYFSPNTHLTGEALALYVCGLSFPELAASRRWHAHGRRILLDELDRQICADGGHAERSTHYHRYTLDFYLLALLAAERAQDTDAIARFSDAAVRAAEFARAMADDAGRFPLIGDDDGGMLTPVAGRSCEDVRDSLALAAVVLGRPDLAPWGLTEEVFWLAGPTALEQEPFVSAHRLETIPAGSRTFADSGYLVARDGAGSHLVFDVGPHGYLNGGHAHADALSITLTLGGSPLLVDPGTSTYTVHPAIRDRLRGTASHNTLTLDGQPSSHPGGPFHWRTRTDARVGAIRHNPRFDWAEGWHDGFPSRHRRTVMRAPAGLWIVVDEVLGQGRHEAGLHWHFDPAWIVSLELPSTLRAVRFEGDRAAWLVHDASHTTLLHGDDATGLGWFAPAYGTLIPTWTARVSQSGEAPFSIVTCLAAAREAPRLQRIGMQPDAGGGAIGLRVRLDSTTSTTMVRAGESEAREGRGCGVGEYHTDARLLHYETAEGRLRVLAACDAHYVLALRDGWLSLAADEPMRDICVDAVGARLDVWSSSPASRVRLQGAAVVHAAEIRLNGRVLPPEGRERADSAAAFGWDWGEPGRLASCAVSPASPI